MDTLEPDGTNDCYEVYVSLLTVEVDPSLAPSWVETRTQPAFEAVPKRLFVWRRGARSDTDDMAARLRDRGK